MIKKMLPEPVSNKNPSPLRVLIVCDREYWVLCEVARNLQRVLSSDDMHITVLVEIQEDIQYLYTQEQLRHDVVHLLGPGSLYYQHQRLFLPCVATLWHMEEWTRFDATIYRADALFVCSQQWIDLSKDHIPPGLPVRRMRYGVDRARFSPDPTARPQLLQQSGLADTTLVFGFSANVEGTTAHRKGLDRLWECFIRLREVCDIPFLIYIIGRGWSLEKIPATLQPVTRVDSFIENPQLPQFYASLDYYICTSRMEGGPYPVLEAMSCERVVISTEVGVVPEIITHGENGFLLREDSLVEDFVESVQRTAPDAASRAALGRAAREAIVRDYSWDTAVQAEAYEEAYRSAIRVYRERPLRERLSYIVRGMYRGIKEKFRGVRRRFR